MFESALGKHSIVELISSGLDANATNQRQLRSNGLSRSCVSCLFRLFGRLSQRQNKIILYVSFYSIGRPFSSRWRLHIFNKYKYSRMKWSVECALEWFKHIARFGADSVPFAFEIYEQLKWMKEKSLMKMNFVEYKFSWRAFHWLTLWIFCSFYGFHVLFLSLSTSLNWSVRMNADECSQSIRTHQFYRNNKLLHLIVRSLEIQFESIYWTIDATKCLTFVNIFQPIWWNQFFADDEK